MSVIFVMCRNDVLSYRLFISGVNIVGDILYDNVVEDEGYFW